MYGRGAALTGGAGTLAYTGFDGGTASLLALALIAGGGMLLTFGSILRRRETGRL